MIEALLHAERLLVHGQVDQAEQIYSNAIERDPRNAIAVVGLARVALERGDEPLAYDRACAALEIDPQNAAALRLEARLSEVFTTRGEPVTRPSVVALSGGSSPQQPVAPTGQGASVPAQSAHARPSEQVVFTRNPSMAEHQRMQETRIAPDHPRDTISPPDSQTPALSPDAQQAAQESTRRPSLLRRLLGDRDAR